MAFLMSSASVMNLDGWLLYRDGIGMTLDRSTLANESARLIGLVGAAWTEVMARRIRRLSTVRGDGKRAMGELRFLLWVRDG